MTSVLSQHILWLCLLVFTGYISGYEPHFNFLPLDCVYDEKYSSWKVYSSVRIWRVCLVMVCLQYRVYIFKVDVIIDKYSSNALLWCYLYLTLQNLYWVNHKTVSHVESYLLWTSLKLSELYFMQYSYFLKFNNAMYLVTSFGYKLLH